MCMIKLFDRFAVDILRGKDITMGKYFPGLFISDHDEVFYYSGVRLSDDVEKKSNGFAFPYYMSEKHSTDPSIANEITGFYRVIDGCIVIDDFVDSGFYSRRFFKKIDAAVRYPSSDRRYGVFVDRKEDEELTRTIFGFTYDELTLLLEVYAKIMGTHNEWRSYPRITRSFKNEFSCDLSSMWIPESFPHIAFDEGGYHFSHVSLWGFYRQLQLLTCYRENSIFSRVLLKYGAKPEILKRLFEIGENIHYQTKVIKTKTLF